MVLSRHHRILLKLAERGIDVLDRHAASTARQLERAGLVAITRPIGEYRIGDRYPYFAAVTTQKGAVAAREGRT